MQMYVKEYSICIYCWPSPRRLANYNSRVEQSAVWLRVFINVNCVRSRMGRMGIYRMRLCERSSLEIIVAIHKVKYVRGQLDEVQMSALNGKVRIIGARRNGIIRL